MRILIVILTAALPGMSALAQKNFAYTDSMTRDLFEHTAWEELGKAALRAEKDSFDYFGLNYRAGIAFYMQKQYASAERFLTRALQQNSLSPEAGSYLCAALMAQGWDMEAAALRRRHPLIEGADSRKVLEQGYAEGGLKMSLDPAQSGNISYYSVGLIAKVPPSMRLWQSVTCLRRDRGNGSFSQWEYFLSAPAYLGRYWYVKPAVHWARTGYETNLAQQDSVDSVSHQGPYLYRTRGHTTTNYQYTGHADAIHAAIACSRRYGAVTLEAEPSFHYIRDNYSVAYAALSSGRKDTLLNGSLLRSGDYQRTDSGRGADSIRTYFIPQIGIGLTWRLPFWKERISARLMAYYLSYNGIEELDWSFYSLIRFSRQVWLHLGCVHKNELPLSLTWEGQYFNASDPLDYRFSSSVQLRPLRPFSFMLTWQYEQQHVDYQSFYLSLKFNL